jgi:hypothetical protein
MAQELEPTLPTASATVISSVLAPCWNVTSGKEAKPGTTITSSRNASPSPSDHVIVPSTLPSGGISLSRMSTSSWMPFRALPSASSSGERTVRPQNRFSQLMLGG